MKYQFGTICYIARSKTPDDDDTPGCGSADIDAAAQYYREAFAKLSGMLGIADPGMADLEEGDN